MTELTVVDNGPSAPGRLPRHAVRLFLCDGDDSTMMSMTRSQPNRHHPLYRQSMRAPTSQSTTTNNSNIEQDGPALCGCR